MEAAEAKDLIDEAIERTEESEKAGHAGDRRFRDRVSVLVGLLAVCLAIVHMAAAAAARENLLRGIEASDTFAYMQAKIIRETVLKTASGSAASPQRAAALTGEAQRLRAPDKAGHGIGQLQKLGEEQRRDGIRAATASEGYELGETALQLAIVLLSIALVARSRPIVAGASVLAVLGLSVAVMTKLGFALPWLAAG